MLSRKPRVSAVRSSGISHVQVCAGEIPFILLIISKVPKTKRDILWLKAKGDMWASAGDNTLAGAGPQCSPPVRLLGKGKLPWSPNTSGHFVLIFRRRRGWGKEERGLWRSRPAWAVCSLIRRNHEAELGDLLKTKPALGWVSSFYTSVPLQNNKGRCGAKRASLSPALPALLPVQTSHHCFISCSWLRFESLFHVLTFKCGKHYQHPPWIFVVVVRGRGDFFFSFFFFLLPLKTFFFYCGMCQMVRG